MKVERYMSEDMLIKKSVEVLIDSLGPVEAVRFLNISREKKIDSVKRHQEWQKKLDKNKFFTDIFGE